MKISKILVPVLIFLVNTALSMETTNQLVTITHGNSEAPRLKELCIKKCKEHCTLKKLMKVLKKGKYSEESMTDIARGWMHNHPVFTDLEKRFPFVPVRTLKEVGDVFWSPNGELLATAACKDNKIHVWDAATGTCKKLTVGATDDYWHRIVSWSPDNTCLATAKYGNKEIQIWDVSTGQCLQTLEHDGYIGDISWSPKGVWLAVQEDENPPKNICFAGEPREVRKVKIWDVATGKNFQTLAADDSVVQMSWDSDGKWIATNSYDKTVKIWDAATGECLHELIHNANVRVISWSPDGKWLATGPSDTGGAVKIWDAATGECFTTIDVNQCSIYYISWSPDSTRIAIGLEKTVSIWGVEKKCHLRTLKEIPDHCPPKYLRFVGWSPDGKWIATRYSVFDDYAHNMTIWDAATGQWILETRAREFCWSPDGKRFVTSFGHDGAQIWEQGEALKSITSYRKAIKLEKFYEKISG